VAVSALTCDTVLLTSFIADKDRQQQLSHVNALALQELPLVYDADKMELYWQQHKCIVFQRQLEILASVLPFLAEAFTKWDILTLAAQHRRSDRTYFYYYF
jgi:hypothetical protein